MIGYQSSTTGRKNKDQGAKIKVAMGVLIVLSFLDAILELESCYFVHVELFLCSIT